MVRKTYPVVFIPEEKGFSVIFPDFSGGSQGDNLEEAMHNAKEFLDGMLSYYIEQGLSLPQPSNIHEVQTENRASVVTLIQGDPTRFLQKKTIRKNVTIPEWLAVKAEKEEVNFSKILTDELFKRYG